MMAVLIRKEILNNLLNLRFAMAYFLCTVLLVGSAAIMVSDYLAERKMQVVNDSVSRREIEDLQDHESWNYMIHRTVAREPLLTGVFALGAEKDPDRQATMSPYFSPDFSGDLRRNPMANFFPTIDLAFIVGIILSLLIFALCFDAVSGECEGGTLKVLLGGPVSRAAVIAAKWTGTYLTIMIPCVTAWVATALIVAMNTAITVPPQDWLRIAGMFLSSAIFIACVVSLAVMMSTVSGHGTTALLALLAGWVIFVVGIPSLSGPVAALVMHVPPSQELECTVNRYATRVEKTGIPPNPAMENVEEHELAGRKWDSLPQQEKSRINRLVHESGLYWDRVYLDKISQLILGYLDKRVQAENLAQWIARISPYGCFQDACVTLAGTGMAREREMTGAAVSYNRVVYDYANLPQSICPECRSLDYGPVMAVHRTGVANAAAQALPDVGIMALMTVLFFLAAFVAFMRRDIV